MTLFLSFLSLSLSAFAVGLVLWRTRKSKRTVKLKDGWEMTESTVRVENFPTHTALICETRVCPENSILVSSTSPSSKQMFRDVAKGVRS